MMTNSTSVFSRTNRIFENAKFSHLKKHEIDFPSANQVVQISSRLFQILDRDDPLQADVSLQLWLLKSSILFTFLPFDDPGLRLMLQMNELEQASGGLPDTAKYIEQLKKHVTEIVDGVRNPKRELFLELVAESIGRDDGNVGLFSTLSAGKSPGWPSESTDSLSMLSDQLMLIGSRRQLRSNVFGTVILPCACANAPYSLISELLFSSCTARFEVLLYNGEKLQLPKRLMPPSGGIFEGILQQTEIEQEVIEILNDSAPSAVDAWVNEAFWQGLHGAERTGSFNLVPANYMLFCDGTGTFLPANGRVLTLPADGVVIDDRDLSHARVEDVCEGDLIVLRSGDSGFLLDEASDRIMGSEENDSLFEIATDWKAALEALLVTHSNNEIAQALRERGVQTSAASIHQWIGPEVLGPRDEEVFRALIKLLADKGKIKKAGTELTSYVDSRWNSLQGLRSVRQKAGNLIRQDLFKTLFNRIKNGDHKLADGERIHIEGDAGAELLILRVSSADRNQAHVPPSRIGEVDDLRGNKWLG
jgi:hypothetical protein